MMKKYIKFFMAIFIVLLIMRLPANLIVPLLIDSKKLKIQQITGTIWQGDMQSNYFNNLHWNINFSSLLLGKLSAFIEIKINQKNYITTDVNLNIINELSAKNTNGYLTIDYLETKLNNIPSIVHGDIEFINTDIVLNEKRDFLQSIKGTIIVRKLEVLATQLGDFQGKFATKNDKISALITGKQNKKLKTKLNITLDKNKNINIKGQLKALNKETKNILKSFNVPKKLDYSMRLK